jgi:Zn-dependent M28 family amino/carboxypeptidase
MPEGKDGIWNGADDNASGTAGVIELTRRIAARPGKRSTLIFFTSGEDRGIFGSAYYAANPLVPNQNITVQFNLDMIGRGKDKVQGIPFGAQALFDEAVAAGKAAGMEVIPDQQPAWRVVYLTDTYHFGRAGIPSLFFFTGTHADYHQPSDTGDKIEYGGMSKIVEITEQVARPYLDGKAGPAFVKPEWFRAP